SLKPRAADLAGSEYLQVVHGRVAGRPYINLGLEKRVQELCRRAIADGTVLSAHDCSDGGLAVALAECSILGGIGFVGGPALGHLPKRWDVALFGEGQSRIVVSLAPAQLAWLSGVAGELGVPLLELGVTGGSRFQMGKQVDLALADISSVWGNALAEALSS
ncbi:MAG: phosphoribosylformylglycinamidine synthase II, partial [Chloroflexi bacterium]|nr:phosphoribosylformylglycinamidine synthase II [Chloroflexota bacterium]